MPYLSILSTLATFSFLVAVFRRYQIHHGPHLLLWTIGLLWYGIGTLSEVILGLTFSGLVLRLWYLCGAMLTAAWLGQGTIHLLVRRRTVALTLTGILAALSVMSAALVLTAPLTAAAASYQIAQPISSQYQDMLTRSSLTIALTILLNIYGTLTLIGGAIYSAYLFWRKQVLLPRMIGNILIAAGALAPALGGSFIKVGLPDFLYLTELVGAVLMFIGFLQATAVPASEHIPAPSS